MRIVKIIVGIVCWSFSLYCFLGIVATLVDHISGFMPIGILVMFAVPAIFFAVGGWLLISKTKRPMSRTNKAIVAVVVALLFAFIVVIAVPEFVRMRYTSSQNACLNTLRELQSAKTEWALENGKTDGTVVTVEDITPYIQLDRNGNIPKCPAGGTYILGRVGDDVRCSIGTSDWPVRRVLSDTNDFTWEENFVGAYSVLFGFRHVK